MGYSKCSSPGCGSRPGQGILFKYFPKNSELAEKWRLHLPGLNLSPRTTAVCEKHFEPSMFEKLREDGRRKLRDSAVPTLRCSQNMQPIRVLGDITNANATSSTTPVADDHSVDEMKAASIQQDDIIKKLIAEKEELARQLEDMRRDKEMVDALMKEEKDNSLKLVQTVKEENVINLKQIDALNNSFIVQKEECNQKLDLLQAKTEKQVDFLKTDLLQQKKNAAKTISLLKEENLKEKQNAAKTINLLKEEHQKALEKLGASTHYSISAYHSIRRKYLAQKKVQCRLQQRLDRKLWSPWLHKSQQQLLSRKNARGVKWDPAMIRIGLILKMKCGTRGYSAFVKLYPLLPSARTLQEAVQFIKFDSGILQEMFDLLESMIKEFSEIMKDCILVVDEMAITEGVRYCHSLKKFVGESTFPTHSGRATKALLVLLAGLSKRWKITVAVYFTNKRDSKETISTGEAFKNILIDVISRADKAGAQVCAIGSDMGPDNLSFWREFGVTANRSGPVSSSFPHPTSPGVEVHILPDFIHLFKAIKAMLENNKIIKLPQDIVDSEGLSSNIVDYQHIADLMEFEEGFELKVAFRLKPWNVVCKKHFSKMKVGTSRAVICHRTSVGLDMLAEEKKDPSYKTTAWFVELMNTFFELVSSRHRSMAFSYRDKNVFDKAIALVNKVSYVFQNMSVGVSGHWKPCQRGMRVLCHSLINLVKYLLSDKGYSYVLGGRFLSDCIENIISLIRSAQAVPHAIAVLQNVKVITLCQLSEAVKGSSYNYEEADPITIVDMLEVARNKALERAYATVFERIEELLDTPVPQLTHADLDSIAPWEKCVVYDLAGSVIQSLQSSNVNFCDACICAMKHNSEEPHQYSTVTKMKEYTHLRSDNGERLLQVYVSDEVFRAVLTAELTIRMFRVKVTKLKTTDVVNFFVDNLMYVWARSAIPDCHKIRRRYLTFFTTSRLKEYGRKEGEELKQAKAQSNTVTQLNSKSTAMRECASQIGK